MLPACRSPTSSICRKNGPRTARGGTGRGAPKRSLLLPSLRSHLSKSGPLSQPACRKVGGDPDRPKAVVAEFGINAGRRGAPTAHRAGNRAVGILKMRNLLWFGLVLMIWGHVP